LEALDIAPPELRKRSQQRSLERFFKPNHKEISWHLSWTEHREDCNV
jgi:hypothetical protein